MQAEPKELPYLRAPLQFGVREFVNKSAASAASPDYVKFQAVIKSAASAEGKGAPGERRVPSPDPIRRPADPVVPPSPVVRRSPGAPFP